MRDTVLEYATLRALINVPYAIRPSVLAADVEIRADRRDLTLEHFLDTLHCLEVLGLVSQTKDLLNYTRWTITEKGRDALSEVDGVRISNQDNSPK